jgi:metallo-beta-lactamase family protein
MSLSLSFHGGVESVTGSCYRFQTDGPTILVDCGMFQGGPELEQNNSRRFDFDPASIDYLILTHGHLDHCGRIPLLVKSGFSGEIISTGATYDVAKLVLLDSAHIQEEDYGQWKKIKKRRGVSQPGPLYTVLDAVDAIRYFTRFAGYGVPVRLDENIAVTFKDAGHILGSSFVEINIGGERKILFSGDLGNRDKPIIRDPSLPASADTVILETTYANRNHRSMKDSIAELGEAITDTFRRGGNVIIPSFAIERAQDLLFILREMYRSGKLPKCRIFLDSPMAINITEIMQRHPECYDKETLNLFKSHENPFDFPWVTYTKTPEASRAINGIESRALIIAGSGMCTGGRIKHHLKHNIWRKESSIIFVGYQAEGTLGRSIVDGEEEVRIFDETYKVNAEVFTIGGFSAHADRSLILDWLGHCTGIKDIFLVHGESDVVNDFSKIIGHMAEHIHIPRMSQRFQL